MAERTMVGPPTGSTVALRRERKVAWPWGGVWPESLAQAVMPPATLVLRLVMGWIFVWSGFDKLIRGFDSSGFLINASQGPLHGWFVSLGENTAATNVINPLVVWGQILIGLALIFGLGTRFALFWAAAMMFMFYIVQFPPAHNPFMDEHLVYIGVFGVLGALGAGRILGLDAVVERLSWVRRIRALNFLLG